MIGVELSVEGGPLVSAALERGLLINCTHDYTLRFLPPFLITKAQVRDFLRLLETILHAAISKPAAASPASTSIPARAAHSAAR